MAELSVFLNLIYISIVKYHKTIISVLQGGYGFIKNFFHVEV